MKRKILNKQLDTLYLLVIFILLPVYFNDYLYDIVEAKRNMFFITSIIFAILMFILNIKYYIEVIKTPNFSYISIGLFMITNIISYSMSDNKEMALWGCDGRAFGLLMILVIFAAYFALQNFDGLNKRAIHFISAGSCLVTAVGLLNFFFIDPFGVYREMVSYMRSDYISTLGHHNIYSSYFALTLPVTFIMYLKSSNTKEKYILLILTITNYIGLLVGNSDSGYITLYICIIVALFLCKKKDDRIRLCTVLLLMTICSKIIGLIYDLVNNKRSVDSITKFILLDNRMYIIILVLIIWLLVLKTTKIDISISKIIAISGIVITMLLPLIALLRSGFTISDSWGSNRGFIWKRSLDIYVHEYDIKNILIGCGPDSVLPVIEKYCGTEIIEKGYEHYNNVHNEYLQYLMTTGIVGLLFYLLVLVTTIRNYIKSINKSPEMTAIFTGCICYAAQALVNVNQAVTTPLFFIYIALLSSKSIKAK